MLNQDIIVNVSASNMVHAAPPSTLPPQAPRSQSILNGIDVLHKDNMSNDTFEGCVRIIKNYPGKFTEEREIAKYIKDQMERRYGKYWQVVVASSTIGCMVAHESRMFFHFRYNDYLYIIYRVPDVNAL